MWVEILVLEVVLISIAVVIAKIIQKVDNMEYRGELNKKILFKYLIFIISLFVGAVIFTSFSCFYLGGFTL